MDQELLLIERARNGERAAFDSLVDIYKGKAFALAYNFTGNAEDAKDVLQEAFVKAYLNIKRFRGGSAFYTWFYRILVNQCRDALRKKQSKMKVLVDMPEPANEDDAAPFEAIENGPGPGEALLNKEIREKVDGAINMLPEKQKMTFILRHMHGMKLGEIAGIIKCSESTAKVHLFRATKNLQKALSPYIKTEGGGEYGVV
ncbi:MAG: sigma-70 family RNA polymerase sigma factor [Candidatus Omnitrophica bacterium]|nr:sigma-70 family RNA polymerase sigma factor [Candidatus Omnitrophota bacterium]